MTKRRNTKSEIVKTFTLKELTDSPAPSLSIEQMGDYMRAQLNAIGGYYKKVARHIYYLGEALVLAREQFKEEGRRDWGEYLDKIGISPATATRARQLYDWVESPEDLSDMTVTEAYRQFGILQPKQLTEEKPNSEKKGNEEGAEDGQDDAWEEAKDMVSEKAEDDQPAPDKTPLKDDESGEDLSGEKSGVSKVEAVIPIVNEQPSEPQEPSEDQPAKSSGEKQPEIKVTLDDVTVAEMDAFTAFVEIAGGIDRAKAIFKTCVKARMALDVD
jgi:hypothetical protein